MVNEMNGGNIMNESTQKNQWKGFAASVPGGGHIRYGIPCQDASLVLTSPRPAAIVCDGRGSAKLSHFGAQGAVAAFKRQVAIMEPFLAGMLDCEEENQEQWIKFCRIMYRTLMQVKYDLSEEYNMPEKEFDATVAFAIAGKHHIGCFQVGDGAIVLRQNNVCMTVFKPEKGEFTNQTHFLRAGGEEKMKFQYALFDAEENGGIVLSSDGPEYLMFQLSDMTPGRIFHQLLDDLQKDELCRQDIMDYLTRNEWYRDPRGADDRSLALLMNPAIAGNAAKKEAVPEEKDNCEPMPSEAEAENVYKEENPAETVPPSANTSPEEEKEAIPQVTTASPPEQKDTGLGKGIASCVIVLLLAANAVSFVFGIQQKQLYIQSQKEYESLKTEYQQMGNICQELRKKETAAEKKMLASSRELFLVRQENDRLKQTLSEHRKKKEQNVPRGITPEHLPGKKE